MAQISPPPHDATEVFDVVHARVLRFFPELVADLGGDLNALLAKVHVSGVPETPSAATYRQTIELVALASSELACPDFGLRLASLQRGEGMFGPLGLVMKNSSTFGDALNYVCSHAYAHSLATRIRLKRLQGENAVFVGHDVLVDGVPNRTQAMEQILLLGHLAASDMTGGYARVRRVHFRHQPVSPLTTYRRYFGCEVLFGQNEDGVVFSDRDLAAQIISPDAHAYENATSFIDAQFTQHRPPLCAETRGVIMSLIGAGDCSNERVAAELNLHPRTLHRRLAEEGTSFQNIKDEVRRDYLLYYLQQTDLDFASISARLGFAEQSVMTRSCNRWFSVPPTTLRLQRTQPRSP